MPRNPRSSPSAGRAPQAPQNADAQSHRGPVTTAMAALLGRRPADHQTGNQSRLRSTTPVAPAMTPSASGASRATRGSAAVATPRDPAEQTPSHAEAVLHALAPSSDQDDEVQPGEYYEDTEEDVDEALVDEIADELLDEVELGDELEYDGQEDGQELHPAALFDAAALGLKEINNLAHFSVSSHKPGNGVAELLSEDLDKYWQSDGQQPHHLTIHFLRRVEIRAIRFYVDYSQDESYTPTLVNLSAGTGHHDLIEFASMPLSNPVGWQDVDLSQIGGGEDGQSLCCWIVQMQVKENHQNGKDTHIRALKIYALDENAKLGEGVGDMEEVHDMGAGDISAELGDDEAEMYRLLETPRQPRSGRARAGSAGLSVPDFMRDFEIR